MKTKILLAAFLVSMLGTGAVMAETIKNIQYRIENMHCGGCAGRVKKALNSKDGIDKVDVDLEKRVVTISYDEDKITPDVISSTLTEAKYAPAAYSVNDVIERTASFKASEMRCGGCANKVKKNLGAVPGITNVDVDLDKKSVKITYDANKVSRSTFKDDFKKFNYTVTAYYPNEIVAYALYNVKNDDLSASTAEELSKVKGILDVNVNAANKVVAVTYNTKVMDEAALKTQLANLNLNIVAD